MRFFISFIFLGLILSSQAQVTTNVYVVDQAFYMPQLDRSRRVTIYLPPDYESSGLSYPVIYMQDGQTLFESLPDWDEMEIDETLNSLSARGYNVPIVVGIDNGEVYRAYEYLPKYFEPLGAGGEGNEYMQFIVETLKPYIDNNYRTLPDRKNTGIIGGSFGGLISWYGAIKYQNIFSKCGVFSPAYWGNHYDIWNYLSEFGFQQDIRFYQNVGENEHIDQYINYMYKMADSLQFYGFNQVYSKVIPNGYHCNWADFENAYLWLFSDYAAKIDSTPKLLVPPYANGFDDIANQPVYTRNIEGDQSWQLADYGNPQPCAFISGFDGSTNVANEDWLIIPAFDFTNVINPVLQFDEAINYANAIETEQSVLISTNYFGDDDPNSATWTKLNVTNRASGNDWSFVTVSPIDLSDYVGEDVVYIAFKYTSTVSSAATWEIDNINITSQTEYINTSLPTISNMVLHPNPVQDLLYIKSENESYITASIFDLQGKRIRKYTIPEQNFINVNDLKEGVYLLKLISSTGITVQCFVKQ
ncbi:MAG: alpha/beta hydrolase-fold protein [Bacteroidales bacterium]|jgi:predicted alpha/beta superfamily hydrolase|nr:alpha/beta hydrolase-fold protein [Bacteroidales bacterium]